MLKLKIALLRKSHEPGAASLVPPNGTERNCFLSYELVRLLINVKQWLESDTN